MSKVTSKLQVSIPRAIARRHGIEPGSEIVFESAGEVVRVRPVRREEGESETRSRREVLEWFDAATERQRQRNERVRAEMGGARSGRGWTRESLYEEGGS